MALALSSEARAGLARAQQDPDGWIERWLGADLHDASRALCRAVRDHPRVACKAAHAVSKSFTAARIAIWFLHAFPPAVVLTTAPTYNQVVNILWREIGAAYATARRPLLGRLLETRIEIADRWYALGFKAADTAPDRFQGFHADHLLVIKDEASGIHPIVHEALDSTLSSGILTRELMIGNPIHAAGHFYDAFHSKRSLYHTMTIAAADTPNFAGRGVVRPYLITPAWAEEKRLEHGEESAYYLSRVLAEFPRQGVDSLIPLAWCEAARARPARDGGGAVEIGVDVAREGDDESGYYLRCGPDILRWEFWRLPDLMQTAGRIAAVARAYGARVRRIRVDAIGVGAGVADALRQEFGRLVEDVNVGAAPSTGPVRSGEPEPLNLKAELYWGLRELLRTGAINGLEDEETISQLVAVRYATTVTGKFKIELKEDYKRRVGRSPDRAEALLLAFTGPDHDRARARWGAAPAGLRSAGALPAPRRERDWMPRRGSRAG